MPSTPQQPSPDVATETSTDASQGRPRRRPARPGRAGLAFGAAIVLVVLGLLLPAPYVVEQPGPVENTLGKDDDGDPLITISGTTTYPTSGELSLTTVGVVGGPGNDPSPGEVALAWFRGDRTILPREAVYPEGTTREQNTQESAAEMATSEESAVAAALTQLGVDYTTTVGVSAVTAGSPAADALREGDVITAIDGKPIANAEALTESVSAHEAGDTLTVTVVRDGRTMDVRTGTTESDGRTVMGVNVVEDYEFPYDISIDAGDIGGPSAGTMFALGIYDLLTPGHLTGGKDIAGTGTIDADGTVGAIGGIQLKMKGASEDGADYFLAPKDNCDEVKGHVPDGLKVVAVSTFDDAVAAAEQIGTAGNVDGLPTCS